MTQTTNYKKLKNLVLANGIVGLVGGIILLFGGWIVLGAAAGGDAYFGGAGISFLLLKVAILVLGILGILKFKELHFMTKSPSVLIIVGGALALIPFLGWVGGILAIIGGSMYLSKLKNFN